MTPTDREDRPGGTARQDRSAPKNRTGPPTGTKPGPARSRETDLPLSPALDKTFVLLFLSPVAIQHVVRVLTAPEFSEAADASNVARTEC